MVSVTAPDGTSESYSYCGDGIRRTATDGAGTRLFIRDGQNILLEAQQNGGTLRRYTHEGESWGGLLSLNQGSTSRYYGFDGSANTRLLTDENAGVSDAYLYSAFGEELLVTGSSANPLRFGGEVGYYRDEDERLYVRARHLDVGAGRWLSRDPIGFESGDSNFYRYVGNQPVTDVDPSGLSCSPTNVKALFTNVVCDVTRGMGLTNTVISDYDLRAFFRMEWTVGKRKGSKQSDCYVGQWFREDGSGGFRKDDATGWPYPFSCLNGECGASDEPGLRPGIHGLYPIFVNDSYNNTFITCLYGTEGPIACFRWRVDLSIRRGKVTTCKATGPERIHVSLSPAKISKHSKMPNNFSMSRTAPTVKGTIRYFEE